MIPSGQFERRMFWIGGWLVAAGGLLTGIIFGFGHGASFLVGGVLSAVNMKLLVRLVNSALARGRPGSGVRIAATYILRLLLIPLVLYGIMHFFFFGVIAATAGFVVFSSSIIVEGIFEAFKNNSR